MRRVLLRLGICAVTFGAAVLSLAALSALAHDDFSPRDVGGKIVVGYYNDGFIDNNSDDLDDNDGRPISGTTNSPVFGYDVALNYDLESPADDHYFFSEDPGIHTTAGLLPLNKTLTSNLLSFTVLGNANAANLFYWDGSGTIEPGSFAPVIGVTLQLSAVNGITLDGTNTPLSGFSWGDTDATDGHIHDHALTTIDDLANPAAEPDPPAGIYLIGLTFGMTGLMQSDPVWAVYSASADENAHDDAIDWLSDHLPLVGGASNGDFDDNGVVNAADIDILWHIVRGTGADPDNNDTADLNGDTLVNEDDVDTMLAGKLTAGTDRAYGDANLSGGTPELTDYNLWRTGTGGWAGGDFNGSGGVPELNDYNLWRTGPTQFPGSVGSHGGPGFGASAQPSGAPGPLVPEPATIVLSGLTLPVLLVAARRRRK